MSVLFLCFPDRLFLVQYSEATTKAQTIISMNENVLRQSYDICCAHPGAFWAQGRLCHDGVASK